MDGMWGVQRAACLRAGAGRRVAQAAQHGGEQHAGRAEAVAAVEAVLVVCVGVPAGAQHRAHPARQLAQHRRGRLLISCARLNTE